MKNLFKTLLITFILGAVLLGLPAQVSAQGPTPTDNSPVVFGGDYLLPSGMVIDDLVVFGGNARLEAGSTVSGDVVVFGGNLDANGTVRGNIATFGGTVRLGDSTVVEGNLSSLGGSTEISPKAIVRGQRVTGVGNLPLRIPSRVYTPGFWVDFGPGFNLLSAVFMALILAALAVLLALILPQPIERVAQTIGTQPFVSGALGLLTLVVAPALFIVLMITIILIPVGILGILVFALAVLYGWLALGLEVGKRIAALFKTSWPLPVSAGVGTLIFSLVTNLIFALTGEWFWTLCCVGIPVFTLIAMVSLGGVLASRFGTQVYNSNNRTIPPAPPAAPQTPQPIQMAQTPGYPPAQPPQVPPAAAQYPQYPQAPDYPQTPPASPFPQPPMPPQDANPQ